MQEELLGFGQPNGACLKDKHYITFGCPKCNIVLLDSGKCFGFWEVLRILGSVLDSGKCFWILGSVLSLRATVNQLYLNTVNGSASWFSDMLCDNRSV